MTMSGIYDVVTVCQAFDRPPAPINLVSRTSPRSLGRYYPFSETRKLGRGKATRAGRSPAGWTRARAPRVGCSPRLPAAAPALTPPQAWCPANHADRELDPDRGGPDRSCVACAREPSGDPSLGLWSSWGAVGPGNERLRGAQNGEVTARDTATCRQGLRLVRELQALRIAVPFAYEQIASLL